jgi:3D (Asp-Asp-Asp) domain-containing protein
MEKDVNTMCNCILDSNKKNRRFNWNIGLSVILILIVLVLGKEIINIKKYNEHLVKENKKMHIQLDDTKESIKKSENSIKEINNKIKEIEKNDVKNRQETDSKIKEIKNEINKIKKKFQSINYIQSNGYMGSSSNVWRVFNMTHYTASCKGCSGITKTGINVANSPFYNGMRIIAVDPNIIPLGSIVEIKDGNSVYKAQALDIGGAISGYKIDMLVGNRTEAISKGKREVQIRIIRKGW